jgi:hypothetical protein
MSSARRQWSPRMDRWDLAPNAHPSPQWCQNRCWDRDGVFLGAFAASVAALRELAALRPGDVDLTSRQRATIGRARRYLG